VIGSTWLPQQESRRTGRAHRSACAVIGSCAVEGGEIVLDRMRWLTAAGEPEPVVVAVS
jgi:hypothetical protein